MNTRMILGPIAALLLVPAVGFAGEREHSIEGIETVRVSTQSGSIYVLTSDSAKSMTVTSDSNDGHYYHGSGEERPRRKYKHQRRNKKRGDEWDEFFGKSDSSDNKRQVSADGKVLTIKYRSADVKITLPEGMNLELSSKSGDLMLKGKYGNVSVKTMSGDLSFSGDAGKIDGGTLSGDVKVDAKASVQSLVSISGDVVLKGSARDVNVSSTSGDLEIYYLPERLDAKTVSGEVRAKGGLVAKAVHTYETVSGELLLWLTDDEGFTVNASTFDSDIYIDGERMSGRADKKIGSGSATIRVKSMNGDIRIKRER